MTKTLLVPGPSRTDVLAPGSYATNGSALFRVVSRYFDTRGRPFAALEDCMTLNVSSYTPEEIDALHLRAVTVQDR